MNAIKKIISIVLVIATMMCIAIPAIAAEPETETKPEKKEEILLANGADIALTQHAADTAAEEKKWTGEENTWTDENGTNWKYVYDRNYIVSKDDSNYLYQELADGTIAIIFEPTADEIYGEVKIPSKLDGKTVSKIGAFAFYCRIDITGIRVPDSVKEIAYYAFASCTKLERIAFGSDLEKFSLQATAGIPRTQKIQICFAGSEEAADKIVVWDKAKLNAKQQFDWLSFTNAKDEEGILTYNVDIDKLPDTTTEYNLFVWFFKVYLKSFFDNFIALCKANFDGLVILFTPRDKEAA